MLLLLLLLLAFPTSSLLRYVLSYQPTYIICHLCHHNVISRKSNLRDTRIPHTEENLLHTNLMLMLMLMNLSVFV